MPASLGAADEAFRTAPKGNYRRYFVMHGTDRQPIGIAERTAKGKGGLAMVLAFVSKPTYRKTFDFHQIAQREAEARLRDEAVKAVAEARRTRRWGLPMGFGSSRGHPPMRVIRAPHTHYV